MVRDPLKVPDRYNKGYIELIVKVADRYKVDRKKLAYILATVKHETNDTFKPVVEAYWLSENWRRRNLRYYPWHGRGFVQLTWKYNYEKASEKLGLDLTTDPNAVMEPDVSAKILVVGMLEGWFTGKKLSDYIRSDRVDYVNARRIINGKDKATLIAKYAEGYDRLLEGMGYDK